MGREQSTLVGKNVWKEFPKATEGNFFKFGHEAMTTQQYRQPRSTVLTLINGFKSTCILRGKDSSVRWPMVNPLFTPQITDHWDIVITDLIMPGRSGLEALEQIKISKPTLPVLVLSIHSEELFAVRILKAGAAGYLKKGFSSGGID